MAPDSTQQASLAEMRRQELADAKFRIRTYLTARKGLDAIDEIHVINERGVNVILQASDVETILRAAK
jgi:hypothetical protein